MITAATSAVGYRLGSASGLVDHQLASTDPAAADYRQPGLPSELAQAPSSTAAVGYRQWLDSASDRVVAFDLQLVHPILQSDTEFH